MSDASNNRFYRESPGAEVLRRAAGRIREDYMEGNEHRVADLLEWLADEGAEFCGSDHPALDVARGYLGDEPDDRCGEPTMTDRPKLCDARELCCGVPACMTAGTWLRDPYDKPIGVFEGTRWHMHSEPVCADPDCVTYLTRAQMAELLSEDTA